MGSGDSRVIETTMVVTTAPTDNIVAESTDAETTELVSGDSQMPDLIGKNFEDKKAQLEKDGWLYLTAVYDYDDKYKAGLIIDQSLDPGTPFSSGSVVEVTVSKGPSFLIIP